MDRRQDNQNGESNGQQNTNWRSSQDQNRQSDNEQQQSSSNNEQQESSSNNEQQESSTNNNNNQLQGGSSTGQNQSQPTNNNNNSNQGNNQQQGGSATGPNQSQPTNNNNNNNNSNQGSNGNQQNPGQNQQSNSPNQNSQGQNQDQNFQQGSGQGESSQGNQGSFQNGIPTARPSATQTLILVVQTGSALPSGNSNQQGNQQGSQQEGNEEDNGNDRGDGGSRDNNDNGNNNNGNWQSKNNGERNRGQQDGGEGISDGSVKGVAIGAAAGGALILAILFYVFWRRRKGATFSQIARFKPACSSVVPGGPSGNDGMATLPIYRNDRFSVRSSRDVSANNGEAQASRRGTAAVSSPLAGAEAWKSSHPPKVGSPEALHAFQQTNSSPRPVLSQPQQAHMSSRDRTSSATHERPVMKETDPGNPGLGLFTRHSADVSGGSDNEWPLKSGDWPEEKESPDRWSWSNSNAPPTPRVVASNARTSLQSYPGGQSLAAWLRQGRDEAPSKDHEPSAGHVPLLKNQATQPVLRQDLPSRKGSKKLGNLAEKLRSNNAKSVPHITIPPNEHTIGLN